MPRMATDDFNKVQRQLEATASELGALLLGEMGRLLAEAERISDQPRKMVHKQP